MERTAPFGRREVLSSLHSRPVLGVLLLECALTGHPRCPGIHHPPMNYRLLARVSRSRSTATGDTPAVAPTFSARVGRSFSVAPAAVCVREPPAVSRFRAPARTRKRITGIPATARNRPILRSPRAGGAALLLQLRRPDFCSADARRHLPEAGGGVPYRVTLEARFGQATRRLSRCWSHTGTLALWRHPDE